MTPASADCIDSLAPRRSDFISATVSGPVQDGTVTSRSNVHSGSLPRWVETAVHLQGATAYTCKCPVMRREIPNQYPRSSALLFDQINRPPPPPPRDFSCWLMDVESSRSVEYAYNATCLCPDGTDTASLPVLQPSRQSSVEVSFWNSASLGSTSPLSSRWIGWNSRRSSEVDWTMQRDGLPTRWKFSVVISTDFRTAYRAPFPN